MLGSEIKDYFNNHPILKKHFVGVFAADQVQTVCKRLRNKNIAVLNTDISSGIGKHWWCLLKLENKFGE